MNTHRIQRRRTKGWRMPENTVYVGRGSKWGNPFRVVPLGLLHEGGELPTWAVECDGETWATHGSDTEARFHAVDLYGLHIGPMGNYETDPDEIRSALAGKNLACWCPLDQPCHADVLLELANGGTP